MLYFAVSANITTTDKQRVSLRKRFLMHSNALATLQQTRYSPRK